MDRVSPVGEKKKSGAPFAGAWRKDSSKAVDPCGTHGFVGKNRLTKDTPFCLFLDSFGQVLVARKSQTRNINKTRRYD